MPAKRVIPKEQLLQVLSATPDITLAQLKSIFRCGSETITRELKRCGLTTKPWTERTHGSEARAKISAFASTRTGVRNPNFGTKSRPWMEGDRHPLKVWHRQNPDFGLKQQGAANPVHKVDHLYADPEYVRGITRGLRSHSQRKKGSTYEDVYGVDKAASYKEKLRKASPLRLLKFQRKETKPEATVRGMLDKLGVSYKAQAPLGWYVVDFFLSDRKIIIQVDGGYWHADRRLYEDVGRTPSPRQKQQRRLDTSCDSYLINRGYKVIRLWELDLARDPNGCTTKIKMEMNNEQDTGQS